MPTTTDVANWINNANGKWHDFDGAYGAQCVDLAQFYSQWLGGHRFWGNAVNIYDQPGSFYQQISNSPDPNNVPQLGDIVIWNIGSYGHVAICMNADASGLTTLDQNWYTANDLGSNAVVVRHDWTSRKVKGWLRPKNITVAQATGGNDVADENTVKNLYLVVLRRDADAEGLKTYTGMETSKVFWSLLTSQEYKDMLANLRANEQAHNAVDAQVRQQLADVQVALANEQAKPPKEVIKTVEKIVTKEIPVEVIKEVPVYTHDEETKQNVSAILKLLKSVWGSLTSLHKKVK